MQHHYFNIGDFVIMQKADYFFEYNGFPGIVVGDLIYRSSMDGNTMESNTILCYEVEVFIGDNYYSDGPFIVDARPHQLRKPKSEIDLISSLEVEEIIL